MRKERGSQVPGPHAPEKRRYRSQIRSFAGTFLIGIVVSIALAQESQPPPLNAEQAAFLVRRSAEVTDKNWSVQAQYDWCETDVQHDGSTKTFEELMILGTRYERLVAIDGKPLSTEQAEEEKENLLEAIAQRRAESDEERNKRLAKEQRELNRDHALLDQIAQGMEFSYADEQELDGHNVYVIRATPKSGYRPPNKETEVLKGAQGQLWIDKETLNWVKVEAQVIKPVWIVGFVARVETGTRFKLEMMPMSGSFWMPKHYAMKAHARILLLFPHTLQEDQTYFGYHKAPEYRLDEGSEVQNIAWLDRQECSM